MIERRSSPRRVSEGSLRPLFQLITMLCRFLLTIASSEESTIAGRATRSRYWEFFLSRRYALFG